MIEYIEKPAHAMAKRSSEFRARGWINVEAPTKDELDFLIDKFGVDPGNLHDALDPDEVPRFERHDDKSYIFLRYAFERENETSTAPMLIILTTDSLITISPSHAECLDALLTADSDAATSHPNKLFLSILDAIYDNFDLHIKNISHKIHHLITRMHSHKLENEDFVSFVLIEDQLSSFLLALTPMTAILRRMMVGRHSPLSPTETDVMEDILLGIEQSVNSINSDSRRIVSIREAYSTLSNNSLNRSMKALTAATLIIALPNVVFGMYGMNIALPIQEASWAYPAIVGGTLAVILLIILWARRRRLF